MCSMNFRKIFVIKYCFKIIISSSIQVELAFFNDNLLSWEPLIEPIIDDQGIIQSPWTITCETRQVFSFDLLTMISFIIFRINKMKMMNRSI